MEAAAAAAKEEKKAEGSTVLDKPVWEKKMIHKQ